ncbi:MAG: tRNA lysidine(34) synthetase TilS [Thermotoga sp.]|nr:MAG: tRNA lysidine(34) synthetase TilS [Thermotogota bacterium]RKX53202.1 MAG: tRNA lysidine(34) synthetase TilS [Thermotoga sp.]
MDFEERLLNFIKKEGLISSGDKVIVAVSGGIDSMSLLFALNRIASLLRISLHAAHLDHMIRPESSEEAEFVRSFSKSLGIPITLGRRNIPDICKKIKGNLEEVARKERYAFLEEVCKNVNARRIALAHHKNDLLETVIHRVIRGTGPLGLSCMRPSRGIFIRPFLIFTREEIEEYARKNEIPYVEDKSNYDIKYTRNFIRHKIVPLLRNLNPSVEESAYRLVRTANLLEDFMNKEIGLFMEKNVHKEDDIFVMRRPESTFVLLEVMRKIVHEFFGKIPEFEKLWEFVKGFDKPSHRVNIFGDVFLEKSYDMIAVGRTLNVKNFRKRLKEGFYNVNGFKMRVIISKEQENVDRKISVIFNLKDLDEPLFFRNRKDGDKIFLEKGFVKVKDLMIEEKIPTFYRRRVPILVDSRDRVLWIPGVRQVHTKVVGGKGGYLILKLIRWPFGYLKGGFSFERKT